MREGGDFARNGGGVGLVSSRRRDSAALGFESAKLDKDEIRELVEASVVE